MEKRCLPGLRSKGVSTTEATTQSHTHLAKLSKSLSVVHCGANLLHSREECGLKWWPSTLEKSISTNVSQSTTISFFFSPFLQPQHTSHYHPSSLVLQRPQTGRSPAFCVFIGSHWPSQTCFVSSSVTRSNNRNHRLIAQTDCHFLTMVEDTLLDHN